MLWTDLINIKMYCDWPVLKRCCFCMPLRRGVLVVAYLNVVSTSGFFLTQCLLSTHCCIGDISFRQTNYLLRKLILNSKQCYTFKCTSRSDIYFYKKVKSWELISPQKLLIVGRSGDMLTFSDYYQFLKTLIFINGSWSMVK